MQKYTDHPWNDEKYWQDCQENKLPYITLVNKGSYTTISIDLMHCLSWSVLVNCSSRWQSGLVNMLFEYRALQKNRNGYFWTYQPGCAQVSVYKFAGPKIAEEIHNYTMRWLQNDMATFHKPETES